MLFGAKERTILGFNDLPLAGAQMIFYTFLAMAILFPDLLLSGQYWLYFLQWSEIFLSVVIYVIVSRYLFLYLAKKFPGYDNWKKRVPRLPLVLVLFGLVTLILHFTLQKMINIEISGYVEDRVTKEVMVGVFFALFGAGLYESIYLFVQLKEDQIKLKSIEKHKVQNQLDVLKHQLSPHFLFNCLNTLIYLIDEDQDKSKEFVHKLSVVYKKILDSSAKDVISLCEELEHVNAYTGLLKKRFGENLKFQYHIKDLDLKKKIVPLTLQLGIENAVKHNVVSKKRPLNINIRSEDNFLVIANNLQPKKSKSERKGTGLLNISNRYRLLGNTEIVVENDKSSFVLKLPLLHDKLVHSTVQPLNKSIQQVM